MVEADAQHVGQRCKAGQMAAEVAVETVGLDHHCHRIPAHPRAQALFDLQIAGARLAHVGRDGVDVSGVAGKRDLGATAAGQVDHSFHQIVGAFRALGFNNSFERIKPFLGFYDVWIVGGLGQNLVELG